MRRKFIVIGAGQGGLQAAKTLALAGNDVTVYESSCREKLCHDRIDTVERKLFTDLNIPVPHGTIVSDTCSFVAPFSDKPLYMYTDPETRDVYVERRIFSAELVAAAEDAGVTVKFETPVDSLIYEGHKVCGVIVGGEKIYADLVIDSSGVHSPFRASLHGKNGMTVTPEDDEVFNIYVTYNEANPGYELDDENRWKIYLKFMGERGISWCGVVPDGTVTVLCGIIGKFTKQDKERIFAELQRLNPVLSDRPVRDGSYTSIPVRYPMTMMISDGYAAVGDAAFMTIPLVGNGIANAIRAGQMLAEKIIRDDSVSVETLWKYQAEYYKKIGAVCCLIDCIKRGLLATDNNDLKELIEGGVVTATDIYKILSGKLSLVSANELVRRIALSYRHRGFFGTMGKAAVKGLKATVIALKIPKEYNLTDIRRWQSKLDGIYHKN